jgi:hypothetical protein
MAAIPTPSRRPRAVLGLVALAILGFWLANESAPWWRPWWQVMTAPAPQQMPAKAS